jgi:predicted component of type VI protein secretion system
MSDTNGNISETLNHISANRTLIAKKMTVDEVLKPEVVHGLKNVDQLFEHYKPVLNFRFEDAEGFTQLEELRFQSVDDFSCNNIVQQSDFLTRQVTKKNRYLKLAGQLKSNRSLREVLTDANKRKVFEVIVKEMMEELKKK